MDAQLTEAQRQEAIRRLLNLFNLMQPLAPINMGQLTAWVDQFAQCVQYESQESKAGEESN